LPVSRSRSRFDPNAVIAFAAVLPHPTAEQLFAGAWSACYYAAVQHVATAQKVEPPSDTAVHIEVDLGIDGAAYLLQARLSVSMPGVSREIAELLVHAADEICPYSKATRGNIDVSLNVVS
jgi:Ohr subfamily peroxiredoxin